MSGRALSRASPRSRAGGWRRALLVSSAAAAIAAVFAVGLALGMALRDNPRPTAPITVEHTIEIAPVSAATATAPR